MKKVVSVLLTLVLMLSVLPTNAYACGGHGEVTWSDNKDTTAWYYADIQEATNNHEHSVNEKGEDVWTVTDKEIDWAAREQERADLYSEDQE